MKNARFFTQEVFLLEWEFSQKKILRNKTFARNKFEKLFLTKHPTSDKERKSRKYAHDVTAEEFNGVCLDVVGFLFYLNQAENPNFHSSEGISGTFINYEGLLSKLLKLEIFANAMRM